MNAFEETFSNHRFSATFLWTDNVLSEILLHPSPRPETPSRSPYGALLRRIIHAYPSSRYLPWPDLPLHWDGTPPFHARTLAKLHATIPWGAWTTYGALAAECGTPRGARAVGAAMARNRWPLYIPCHRVLEHNMGLGGFGPGTDLKRDLLRMEGVTLPNRAS